MTTLQIQLPTDKICNFCQHWQVQELDAFGSVLRDDFRPDSDIDLLVEFMPEARHSLLDLVQMELELAEMFNRDVDLVSKSAVQQSSNWIRREAILSTAVPIYVS